MRYWTLTALLCVACSEEVKESTPETSVGDVDQDGYDAPDDCDDGDAAVNPSVTEVCDAVDNNCNGDVDGDATDFGTFYVDTDGDGYGVDAGVVNACAAPAGTAAIAGDCDDDNAAVNPGFAELCDLIDNDCDGAVDDSPVDTTTFYTDADGDGYGDPTSAESACVAGANQSTNAEDCDDTDAEVHPGAAERCDDLDDDCDGVADDGAPGYQDWYADLDLDGYGDATYSVVDCAAPAGFVDDSSDCNDLNSRIYPGNTETCDGFDNDCDGVTDTDALDRDTWYTDADGDGFGDPVTGADDCSQPAGAVADATDCDDLDAGANPAATEVCDGVDNNCDADIDTGAVDALIWYTDADADGYGDPTTGDSGCVVPAGSTSNAADCDDQNATAWPGATEVCDGADNDCDGAIDLRAVDAPSWYTDSDGDGYGDPTVFTVVCDAPLGTVSSGLDCDDDDASVAPDATEQCDGADDDCDGLVDDDDESVDPSTAASWYGDSDGNGIGSASDMVLACEVPANYVGSVAHVDNEVCSSGLVVDAFDEATVTGVDFAFGIADAFTVVLGANFDDSTDGYVLVKGDDTTDEWALTTEPSGTLGVATFCFTRAGATVLLCEDLEVGDYHQYGLTYQDGEIIFYLDGEPAGSGWGGIGAANPDSALTLGNYPGGGAAALGSYDELRIWSSRLNDQEIHDVYLGYLDHEDSDDLVGWWRFDEGSGTTTVDLSGGDNDLTLSGVDWEADCSGDVCVSWIASASASGDVNASAEFGYGPSDSFTVDFTAYIESSGHLLAKGNNSTNEWSITAYNTGGIQSFCLNRQGVAVLACGETTGSGWHDVSAIYDAGTTSIIIDGVVAATGAGSIGAASTSSGLQLNDVSTSGLGVGGAVYRMAIFSRALDASESAVLHEGSADYDDFSDAAAIWYFTDAGAETVVDLSGGGHDIALVGADYDGVCPE